MGNHRHSGIRYIQRHEQMKKPTNRWQHTSHLISQILIKKLRVSEKLSNAIGSKTCVIPKT